MDIISTIKHFFHEFITFKYSFHGLWIINVRYILMSHISKLLDNNSKSEILLSDIKDYAIIPLGSFLILIEAVNQTIIDLEIIMIELHIINKKIYQ